MITGKWEGRRIRPKTFQYLFLGYVGYVVAPIRDIPLIGLSLSAPVFYLLVLALARRGDLARVFRMRRWVSLAGWFWGGMALSAVLNGLLGRSDGVSLSRMFHMLAAYGYWMVVFIVVAYLVARMEIEDEVLSVVGAVVSLLAVLVVVEYLIGARSLGSGRGELTTMSQNEIGISFSESSNFNIQLSNLLSIPSSSYVSASNLIVHQFS